jgi:hypothetical protein
MKTTLAKVRMRTAAKRRSKKSRESRMKFFLKRERVPPWQSNPFPMVITP